MGPKELHTKDQRIEIADPLLSITETARLLAIPVGSLYKWRLRGAGPKSFKLNGTSVRYRLSAVEQWVRDQEEGAA